MEYTPETYNVVHQLYRKKKKKKLKDGENLKKKKNKTTKNPQCLCVIIKAPKAQLFLSLVNV